MAAPNYASPPQAPVNYKTTADTIRADAKRIIEGDKKTLDKIVAEVTPETATFENVFGPYLNETDSTHGLGYRLSFYQSISPDKSLRDASTEAEALLDEYSIDSKMREDIFKLVDAVYEKRESQKLDVESSRIVEKEREQYVMNGLLLPAGPKRDRFKEIKKRLSQLQIQANKNLNEEMGGYWVEPAKLAGVPKDDIDPETLDKGTGENEGKVKVTFKYNHQLPLLKYCNDELTRRDYMIAENNRMNINIPIFQEIIELRDEAARLLGFPSHAHMRISLKMAKTPKRVLDLLNDVRTRVSSGSVKEVAHLLEYKKKDYEERGVSFDGEFYAWDTAYYSRVMKEKEYSIDEAKVAEYFPIQPTFMAMLNIFEEIFGFKFHRLTAEELAKISETGKAEDTTWHEDVWVYSVWNEAARDSSFVGYLYLDMHPRDNKYSHNANFDVEKRFVKADGGVRYTSTALVCNFSKPTASKPALLKHGEVVTLFHELGHGIHGLSGEARHSYLQGTSVAWDFVEAPSQMLENWCWTPSVLKSLSGHYSTGEQIPDDLLAKLMETKHMNSAIATLWQVTLGTFDMTVHNPESHEAVKKMNPGLIYNQLRKEITGIKGPEDVGFGQEWGNRYAGVGHFVGGYDAGYYGYIFSEVFSTDMFHTRFKANPMDKEEGRRYRKLVLSQGGSRDEMQSLTEFLGREPNTEAFYKELGIA